MEYINRIELKGRVGTVRINTVNNKTVANFTLATEHLYKTQENGAASELCWHDIVAWSSKDMPDLEELKVGMTVHIFGRMRTSQYKGADGTDKRFKEVYATKVEFL